MSHHFVFQLEDNSPLSFLKGPYFSLFLLEMVTTMFSVRKTLTLSIEGEEQ